MRIEGINGSERPTGWEAYETYKLAKENPQQGKNGALPTALAAQDSAESAKTKSVANADGCYTCENRKYLDGSDDPGVSFQTPTRVNPEQAVSAVRAHEQEHVTREQSAAQQEQRQVVSQFVTYHNGICSECGKTYIAGGTTTTTTKGKAAYQSTATQPTEKPDTAAPKEPFEAFA